MKVTYENIKNLDVPELTKELLYSDLEDVEEINEITGEKFFIHYQDWHDEYSPERTDPCPDYYGYFSIREGKYPNDNIGPLCQRENELQDVILTIYDTVKAVCGETLYEVRKGWHPLIEEAKRIVRKWNIKHQEEYRIKFLQIKEKYGGLRLYVTAAPKEILDKLDELEEKSYTICENCGSTKDVTTEETNGWVWTLCKKCREKKENGQI